MSAIQKIFQMYGAQYMALYGDRMPNVHKKPSGISFSAETAPLAQWYMNVATAKICI